MSNVKTYGAVAIMIGCFVVIYPRFMHPIVLNVLGMREPPKPHNHEAYSVPPGHKGPHPHERGADDMRRHMRHGPHPGMRAAAEMQRQHGQQGSGRGMMGVVLPMYAVGIVLYLAYTLYKVFNKNQAKENGYGSSGRYAKDRYNREKDRMGFPKDIDSNQDIRNFLYDQQHRENLEDLLTRVDDKNVSVEEMRVLQKRLEETEAQMTRILSAMHAVNANVDNMKDPAADPNATKDEREETGDDDSHQEPGQDAGKPGDDNVTETVGAGDEQSTNDKKSEGKAEADNESGAESEQPNGDGDNDNNEDVVDELIEERKDDEDEDENVSNVRQRNVKTNEQ